MKIHQYAIDRVLHFFDAHHSDVNQRFISSNLLKYYIIIIYYQIISNIIKWFWPHANSLEWFLGDRSRLPYFVSMELFCQINKKFWKITYSTAHINVFFLTILNVGFIVFPMRLFGLSWFLIHKFWGWFILFKPL